MLVLEFAASPHPGPLPVKYGEREKKSAPRRYVFRICAAVAI